MDKSNKTTILSFVLGMVALGIILLVMGVPLGPLNADERADLRLISQPYIESSGIKDLCLASGAAWHEEPDFVGCVGLGPNSCSSDIVLAGQTQCLATGADFYCETGVQGFIYCKY